MRKLLAAMIIAVAALALAPAAARADTTITLPGIGSLTNRGGVLPTNYNYTLALHPFGTNYTLSSNGTTGGFSSTQHLMIGQFQSTLTQSYGGYEGRTCLTCNESTISGPLGTFGNEINVFSNALPQYIITSPLGTFGTP